ncbi:recombinase family protein [Streptomyces sp. NPDC058469]|uniref:recombinase family protein n=1 Tax=Streptomyces sp. NPDC058469 TaxID=3346514 RepID=UPI00364BCBB8
MVRLSFEVNPARDYSGVAVTGADINNREEQERVIREYIERRGGTYVYTYDEPDTSAWKKKRVKQPDGSYIRRVIRPVFDAALKDLKAGISPGDIAIDGLVVSVDDRLTRDHRHLEDAIEAVELSGRPILDVSGTFDLLTESGQDMARIMVTMNGKQSAATARRLRDSHKSRALRGIPVGGNRPFGWAEDKRTVVLREAWQIKAAARMLLAGIKASTIVRKWNEAGRLTTKGNAWSRRTFVNMMVSPRMVGYRVYGPASIPLHMRYLTDSDGNPVKGQYEAILNEHTWHSVVALLAGPDRPPAHENIGKLKYQLSGIMRCGGCMKKISGNAKPAERFDYACKINDGGCGKACGSGLAIDAIVTKLVHARLEEQHIEIEAVPWPKTEELEALNASKATLLAQYKENPDMGAHIFPEVRKKEAAIAALVKERSAHTRKNALPKRTNMVEAWPDLEVEQRRAICAELIEAVILAPATKGSNRFDPARLQIVWRQE